MLKGASVFYLGGEGRVEAQNDNTCVGEDTADDNQVVQIGRRHFDLPRKKHVKKSLDINPFLFIKNKWLFISSEGLFTLEKKTP